MIIDIIIIILAVLAAIRGLRMGLIAGVCSYVALIVGLAAAMKFSAVVAEKIGTAANVAGKWVPFVCFLLIFSLVTLLIRTVSSTVQKLTETLMLGIFNRVGGVVFFVLIYLSAIAILLFYVTKMNLIAENYFEISATYPFVKVLGEHAVNALGYIVPVFKNMFHDLELFFEAAAQKVKTI